MSAESEQGPPHPASGPRGERTAAYTDEQTLWRAATVAAGAPAAVGEPDDLDAPAPGADRYQIREVLGAGGMGEVRLCRDEAIGREVALKTLIDRDDRRPVARRRFLREVCIQGQLEHPSIVPVYDLGTGPGGELFFTMRRVRGHTLAEILTALGRGDEAMTAAFTRRRLLGAFVSVCLAVDYAHTRGVIHRDLKPENIMLGDFGEVYVLDWGVARLFGDAGGAPLHLPEADRRQGAVAGTPGYMAPEQIMGLDELQGPRTDVYALGAILYEILARRPLLRVSLPELSPERLAAIDARPGAVAADAPPELDAVCVRATAAEREARYGGARELAQAVERYLDGDRDTALRRERAEHHVAKARLAEARAHRHGASLAEAEAARAEATRAAIQALALDDEQAQARRLLVRLLLEVPEQLPPSVEAEMARSSRENRLQFARFGLWALVAWALTIPFAAALGVRHWPSFALAAALCLCSAGVAAWTWRRRAATTAQVLGTAALLSATCAALSCWLGPFVLVPTASAAATVWLALHAGRRERLLLAGIGGLGVLAPFVLELLGWVPRSFSFAGDTLVLHARAIHLPPLWTTLALEYSSVAFCVLQPLFLGGIRDALTAAERKLFLQSWHLRQLAADPPEGPQPDAP